jgi:UPF0176 protein
VQPTCPTDPAVPLWHGAFYRFTPLADPEAVASALRRIGAACGVMGAVTVAREGLNGAVCGPAAALDAFGHALAGEPLFRGAFAGLDLKRSACRTPPFARLKVIVKPEIVALGLPGADSLPLPDEHDTTHVSPQAWRALLARDDVVLLDNRNRFEWRLGRFRGAPDPGVDHFRELVPWIEAQAPRWRAEDRTVAMYCTGGIRCDKTAPWLRSLGLKVAQLQGGVLNHFRSLPDAERDWEGECFVFDRRIALDTRLQETATTAEQVFDPAEPGEAWRLARARRLDAF